MMADKTEKAPYIISQFPNGGFMVTQPLGSGYIDKHLAAFSNAVDLIEWLANELIPDPAPASSEAAPPNGGQA